MQRRGLAGSNSKLGCLHYERQANRTGALFSRRKIKAGTQFSGYLQSDVAAEDWNSVFDGECFLGKRRSAGNGRATCNLAVGPPPPWWGQAGGGEAVVQLMSDAVVRGPDGGYLRGLDTAAWSGLLGVPVNVKSAYSSFRPLKGWSASWGATREAAIAIDAGSCWLLTSSDACFGGTLAQAQHVGIGIRRIEGFGWIAVNPPWLLKDTLQGFDAPSAATIRGGPRTGPDSRPRIEPGCRV